MEKLEDFISNTLSNQYEARNFMSFLIGYTFTKDNSPKAILKFYDSMDEKWKADKEAFSYPFLKYFQKFKINEENINYYNEFSQFWTPTNREEIRKFNPNTTLLSKLEEYKNSNEFCKSLIAMYKSEFYNPGRTYDFLEKNNETVINLLKKDRSKFLQNIKKNDLDSQLINLDYKSFDKFCERHKIDQCDLIESGFLKKSGFKTEQTIMRDDTLIYCLQKLESTHESWIKREQPIFSNYPTSSTYSNICDTFISCLFQGYYNSANFILQNYEEKVFELMGSYAQDAFYDDPNYKEYSKIDIFKKTMGHIFREKHRLANRHSYQYQNISMPIEEIVNIQSFVNHFYLDKKLTSEHSETSTDKKQRNKI